jgi:hypothetical protein
MKKVLCIFWILCFGVTAKAWSEPILAGWDYPSRGLVQFDVTTGAYTTILSAPNLQIEALAYDSYNGILYGVVNGVNSFLVEIDWKEGLISNIGIVTGFNEITAMTFDDTTAKIFALDQTTRTLLSIDPFTASPTVIGHFSFGSSNALAANPLTGELFMSLQSLFGSIDKTTGKFTLIGDTGLNAISGLDFLPHTQLLYGVGQVVNGGYQLFTLDLETGNPSFIRGAPNLPQITSIEFIEPSVEVTIDIKPGSDNDSINPKSHGVIPVAILTTKAFDATTVDVSTVHFGNTGMEAAAVQSALEDVDGDRTLDIILHFKTQDTGISCGDTSASLTGETISGQAIQGSETIVTVGCKK